VIRIGGGWIFRPSTRFKQHAFPAASESRALKLVCAACARLLLAVLLAASSIASAQALNTWRGGATPALELADLNGQKHRLADYRGKVVLINFWATWCEPCRDEMPSMQRLKNRFADRPFIVLAVNVGESEVRIDDFLQKLPLDFTILRDHSSAAMKAWRVKALPASFVVGQDGRVRYSHIGELNWDDEKLINTLTRMFR
jgi:thiol-disulfide isomerase/thioredoxin